MDDYMDEPNRLRRGLDFAKQIGKKEKSELISSDFSFLVTRTGIEPMLQP